MACLATLATRGEAMHLASGTRLAAPEVAATQAASLSPEVRAARAEPAVTPKAATGATQTATPAPQAGLAATLRAATGATQTAARAEPAVTPRVAAGATQTAAPAGLAATLRAVAWATQTVPRVGLAATRRAASTGAAGATQQQADAATDRPPPWAAVGLACQAVPSPALQPAVAAAGAHRRPATQVAPGVAAILDSAPAVRAWCQAVSQVASLVASLVALVVQAEETQTAAKKALATQPV